MRFLATLAALVLSLPGWSAESGAGSDSDPSAAPANADAAKLRNAEAEAKAEKERLAQENAKLFPPGARITRLVNPNDYYPPVSVRRGEQGSPSVRVCVGPSGKLIGKPVVTDSSGFLDLDGAVIKIARAQRYAAGTDERGAALPVSCISFKVNFYVDK